MGIDPAPAGAMSSWPQKSTRDIRSAIQRFTKCKLFNSVKMKIRMVFHYTLGRYDSPHPSLPSRTCTPPLMKKRDYSQSNLIRIGLAPSFSPLSSWNQCCCPLPRCYLLITKYDQHFHFWDDKYMEFRMFEPRNEEINEEKVFSVKDATYWDAKRTPEKIQACLPFFAESSGILNFSLSNHCTQHMPIEGLPIPPGNTRGESSWKDKTTVARQFL